MANKDRMLAFPLGLQFDENRGLLLYPESGAELRDVFAMSFRVSDMHIYEMSINSCKALLGMKTDEMWIPGIHWPQVVAKVRYAMADAMMEERRKS